MKKLYEKNEINFALVWIALYVIVMNIALRFCNGFDDLATKTPRQLLIPVICITVLALSATLWIISNGLAKKYGLCRFKGNIKQFLWFVPLVLMSCVNLKNGVALSAHVSVSLLMAVNLSVAGYVEEIIFRGFLFKAMAKENLRSAIIVSSVTFGVGHVVNLINTTDTFGVLLQICYAIMIGFLYTVIVWKGGSLWPCIASHAFVNGTGVFASEHGAFDNLIASVFGQAFPKTTDICSAMLIIFISAGYAIWLLKKA